MQYSTIQHLQYLTFRDEYSGHEWGYVIDVLKPEVRISKNGELLRTVKTLQKPINMQWLEQIREGL